MSDVEVTSNGDLTDEDGAEEVDHGDVDDGGAHV